MTTWESLARQTLLGDPAFAMDDSVNRMLGYAKPLRQRTLAHGGVVSSDECSIIPSQFGPAMGRPSRMASPSLGFHVVNVVTLASQEEMFRVNAEAVIAMVTDLVVSRMYPCMQKPRGTVRQPTLPIQVKDSVTFVAPNSASPFPASGFGVGLGEREQTI